MSVESAAINRAITQLMMIVDGTNWPEHAQNGVGFQCYEEISEQLHEIIADLQGARQRAKEIGQQQG